MGVVHKINLQADLDAKTASSAVNGLIKSVKTLKNELSKLAIPSGGSSTLNAAYKGSGVAASEVIDYGKVRATRAGGTGASARDFAKEAQGLGGLVHLYATWAANIFAVSAAFNVLKEAAEKARLATASELFSARIGTDLKGIALEIQKATDHAVSFQEALQFTNIGTSVGMAKTQIVELTKIAKGAANALGRDTTDSVRRIIQGTAKQEQEILDELGIFVKAKDAYEKYAKQLNIKGGADALSATQKVQAYSQAVLESGRKWKEFAAIEDPFSKFTATSKEVLQSILEIINKGLMPMLNFLAEMPGLIQSIAITLAAALTKRALPEVGKSLKEAFSFSKYSDLAKLSDQAGLLKASLSGVKKEAVDLEKVLGAKIPLLEDRNKNLLAKTLTGTDKTADRSVAAAANAIFGVNSLKDTTGLEKITDFNRQVEKSIANQISRTKDQEALIHKLKQANILDAKAVADKVVLGTRGLLIAEEALVINRATTVQQAQHNAMLERSVVLQEQEKAIELELLNIEKARNKIGASKAPDSVRQGLTAGAALSQTFTNNMAGQIIGIGGFVKTLGSVPALLKTATAGLSGVRLAMAGVSAAASMMATTIGAAVSAFLGPLMLAWTAWELFGDKIKDFIGLTSDLTRTVDKEIEASKSSTKEMMLNTAAMVRYGIEKKAAYGEEYLNIAGKELDLVVRRRAALEDELKALREKRDIVNATGKGPEELTEKERRTYIVESKRNQAYATGVSTEERQLRAKEINALREQYAAEDALAKIRADWFPKQEALTAALKASNNAKISAVAASRDLELHLEQLGTASKNAAAAFELGFKDDELSRNIQSLKDKMAGIDPSKIFLNTHSALYGNALQKAMTESNKLVTANEEGVAKYLQSVTNLGPIFTLLAGDIGGLLDIIRELNKEMKEGGTEESKQALVNKIQSYLKDTSNALAKSKYNASFTTKAPKMPKMPSFTSEFEALAREHELFNNKLRDVLKERQSLVDLAYAKEQMTETDRVVEKHKLDQQYLSESSQAAEAQYQEYMLLMEKRTAAEEDNMTKRLRLAGKDTELAAQINDERAEKAKARAADLRAAQIAKENKVREAGNNVTLNEINRQIVLAEELKKLAQQYKTTGQAIKEYWENVDLERMQQSEELAFKTRSIGLSPKDMEVARAQFDTALAYQKEIFKETSKLKGLQEDLAELDKSKYKNTEEYATKHAAILVLVTQQAEQVGKISDSALEAAKHAGEFAAKMYDLKATEELSDSLADAIIEGLTKGGKEGAKSLRAIIQKALLDPFKLSLTAILNPVSAALSTGINSIVGSVGSSIATNVFGFATGTTLTAGLSAMGTGIVEGFKSALPSIFTPSAATAATQGVAAAAAPGSFSLGNTIGSIVSNPLTWIALPVISALMRKTKTVGGGITGELGGTTHDYALKKKSGWLLGGSKYWAETSDEVSSWDTMIQNSWKDVTKGTLDMAKALGLATTGLENFKVQLGTDTAHPDVPLKGIRLDDLAGKGLTEEQYAEEVRKRIVEALKAGSNELAQHLLGEWKSVTTTVVEKVLSYTNDLYGDGRAIETARDSSHTETSYTPSEFARAGESAIETLTRLSTSLVSVNEAWKILGYTLVEASLAGGNVASQIADSFGGLEKFNSITSTYYNTIYSESERYNTALTILEDRFRSLGYTVPATTSEFRTLVESIGTATPAAQELTAEIMALAPAWDESRAKVKEYTESMTTAFSEALENSYAPAEAGAYVADTVAYSIQKAIYDNGVTAIMDTITSGIINPIIAGAIAGKTATEIIGNLQIESIKQQVITIATALKTLFDNEEFKALIDQMKTQVSGIVSAGAAVLPSLPKPPELREVARAADDAKDATDALTSAIAELAESAAIAASNLFTNTVNKYKSMQTELQSSVQKLQSFISSLKSFKASLLLGNESILTPSQKYLKAKSDFEATAAKAAAGDTEARENLQNAGTVFLTASRDFFASGDQYSQDFSSVMQILDSSITSAGAAQVTLESELAEVNRNLGILTGIDTTLLNIEQILSIDRGTASAKIMAWMDAQGITSTNTQQLIDANILDPANATAIMRLLGASDGVLNRSTLSSNVDFGALSGALALTAQSGINVAEALTRLAGTTGIYNEGNRGYYSSGTAFASGTAGALDTNFDLRTLTEQGALAGGYTRVGQSSLKSALQEAQNWIAAGKDELVYWALRNAGIDSRMIAYTMSDSGTLGNYAQILANVRSWAESKGLPAFAQGINYVPYDMPATIHEGERIFPKADNQELMGIMRDANSPELLQEIRRLNEKVSSLEKVIAQGAVMNAQATDRNTVAVVNAVSTSTDKSIQATNIRERAQLR